MRKEHPDLEQMYRQNIARFLESLSQDIEKKIEIICFPYLTDCLMVCLLKNGHYVFIGWIDAEIFNPLLEKAREEWTVIELEYEDPISHEIMAEDARREDEKNNGCTRQMADRIFELLDADPEKAIEVVQVYLGHGDYCVCLLKGEEVLCRFYSYHYQPYLISYCILPKIEKNRPVTFLSSLDKRAQRIVRYYLKQ